MNNDSVIWRKRKTSIYPHHLIDVQYHLVVTQHFQLSHFFLLTQRPVTSVTLNTNLKLLKTVFIIDEQVKVRHVR